MLVVEQRTVEFMSPSGTRRSCKLNEPLAQRRAVPVVPEHEAFERACTPEQPEQKLFGGLQGGIPEVYRPGRVLCKEGRQRGRMGGSAPTGQLRWSLVELPRVPRVATIAKCCTSWTTARFPKLAEELKPDLWTHPPMSAAAGFPPHHPPRRRIHAKLAAPWWGGRWRKGPSWKRRSAPASPASTALSPSCCCWCCCCCRRRGRHCRQCRHRLFRRGRREGRLGCYHRCNRCRSFGFWLGAAEEEEDAEKEAWNEAPASSSSVVAAAVAAESQTWSPAPTADPGRRAE
mmetsp:Transcript_168696/g.542103  ORF Transcript_168696/g.542103 Transcript_168696/m.542103 type:complete len:288 (-) Transcript_168696:407-1270(-)